MAERQKHPAPAEIPPESARGRLRELEAAVEAHTQGGGYRGDMAWRQTDDPYRILVSEVMLQQTQVSRVEPLYRAFIERFPDFPALGGADTGELLRAWQGLGYNRRALYVRAAAREVCTQWGGALPANREALESLPGIGWATAGAILAYAFNLPVLFIETNIRRTFLYHCFPAPADAGASAGAGAGAVHDRQILPLLEQSLRGRGARHWYYALTDYGAALGRSARTGGSGAKRARANPNQRSAHYAVQSKFAGSHRALRGYIIRYAADNPRGERVDARELARRQGESGYEYTDAQIAKALKQLAQEGFLVADEPGGDGGYRVSGD